MQQPFILPCFCLVEHPYELSDADSDKAEHSLHTGLLDLEACYEGKSDEEESSAVNLGEPFSADILMEAV